MEVLVAFFGYNIFHIKHGGLVKVTKILNVSRVVGSDSLLICFMELKKWKAFGGNRCEFLIELCLHLHCMDWRRKCA